MQNLDKLNKYFWNFTQGASDPFKLKRLLEYASFPDLLKIPFDFFKSNYYKVNLEKLRTSKNRICILQRMKNVIDECQNWDELLFKVSGIT